MLAFRQVVLPKRSTVLPDVPPDERIVYICSETSDFRLVARQAPAVAGSMAVEIGCSYGAGSQLLAKRARHLVGIDVAAEPLHHALSKCGSNTEFHQLDNTRQPEVLRSLLLRCRDQTGTTCQQSWGAAVQRCMKGSASERRCLFIDIGGEGLMRQCEELTQFAVKLLEPNMVCIKSRALWKAACATSAGQARLFGHGDRCDVSPYNVPARGVVAFDSARYRQMAKARDIMVDGAAPKEGTGFGKALSYEPRLVRGSSDVFICRYQNFCKQGCLTAGCGCDHRHCYICDQPGHRALDRVCERVTCATVGTAQTWLEGCRDTGVSAPPILPHEGAAL